MRTVIKSPSDIRAKIEFLAVSCGVCYSSLFFFHKLYEHESYARSRSSICISLRAQQPLNKITPHEYSYQYEKFQIQVYSSNFAPSINSAN